MENNNINTERSALLKEAFDIILKLDDEKLKILLERMGCEISVSGIVTSSLTE